MTPIRVFILLLVLGTAALPADDLTTRDGTVYRNYSVLGHDAGYLTIMYADGGGKIPLSNLPAELQAKYGYDPAKSNQFVEQQTEADRKARADLAQTQLASAQQQAALQAQQRAALAPALQPLSGFAAKFSNSLIVLGNNGAESLDTHALAGVKYWAFYYSASWCPPCRAFTPDLVSFYRSFKPAHPDFELIFVNDDQTEDDMLNYMKNDAMPWPAVRFDDIKNPDLNAEKYCGTGIPDLVLVDANGNVLSDSFQNGTYVGPEHVMDDIRAMVK